MKTEKEALTAQHIARFLLYNQFYAQYCRDYRKKIQLLNG